MLKYLLKELEACEVLPEDCNEEAEAYASTFKNTGLMAMMKMFREKKVTEGFGEATLLKNGSPVVIFTFTAGICKHASPLLWFDNDNVAKGSIKFY
jgi:hypothetical protein